MNDEFACKQHKEAIVSYCLNKECTFSPQCCVVCLQNQHKHHINDIKPFNKLTALTFQYLEQTKEISEYVERLERFFQKQIQIMKKTLEDSLESLDLLFDSFQQKEYYKVNSHLPVLKTKYSSGKIEYENTNHFITKLCEQLMQMIDKEQNHQVFNHQILLQVKVQEESEMIYQARCNPAEVMMAYAGVEKQQIKETMRTTSDMFEGEVLLGAKQSSHIPEKPQIPEQDLPNFLPNYEGGGNRLRNLIKRIDQKIRFFKSLNAENAAPLIQEGIKHLIKGFQLLKQKKYYESEQKFDEALLLQPRNPVIFFHKGNILFDKREFAEAIKLYDQALSYDGENIKVLIQKGNSLRSLFQYQEAIQSYDKAINLDPNNKDGYYNKGKSDMNLGIVLEEMMQYTEAIQCYECALQRGGDKENLEKWITDLKLKLK